MNDQWQSQAQAISERDAVMMRLAITQAKMAEQAGEVPVGAVLACENEVLGVGYNQPIVANDLLPMQRSSRSAMRLFRSETTACPVRPSTSPWSPVPCVRVH